MKEHLTLINQPKRRVFPNVVVPCDGCVKCCIGDAVRLLPGEDASQYETEDHPAVFGAKMLAHKLDGACVYLGESGCTIHDRKPIQCREMDCRRLANIPYTRARILAAHGRLSLAVWHRGRVLLRGAKK